MAASTICSLYSEPLETRDHLFYKCPYSEEVWKNLTLKLLSSHYTNEWEDVIRLLADHTRDETQLFILRYVFQATLSTIWKERNGRRHGEDPHPPAILIKGIDKIV